MPELFFRGFSRPAGVGVDAVPAELFGGRGEVEDVRGYKAGVVGVEIYFRAVERMRFFTKQVSAPSHTFRVRFADQEHTWVFLVVVKGLAFFVAAVECCAELQYSAITDAQHVATAFKEVEACSLFSHGA